MIVCNPLRNSVLLVGAQSREMLIVFFLTLTVWFWSDFDMRCVGTFYASVGEKIQKNCPFCLHSPAYITPVSLLRTSGMRRTDFLCLACEFRVAINEHSGMTTGRKFQYLHWFGLLSLPIVWLWCETILLSALSAARYATHWFLVFGMWISGGYQRTIRHDCRA